VTPPPAAIPDIDGTLVDTNYQHAVAWFRAFRRLDVTLPLYRIHRHIGMGSDQLVGALAGDARELADGWTTSSGRRADQARVRPRRRRGREGGRR
jgi:beta-phosphoglucomutase-like phosphatase (HAD superfamily)